MTTASAEDAERPATHAPQQFPCEQCGAMLQFKPGGNELVCTYCGHENPIPESGAAIAEIDFRQALAAGGPSDETIEVRTVKCGTCAAEFTFDTGVESGACPFCGADSVLAPMAHTLLKPRALLPFAIDEQDARGRFRRWMAGLWFAPRDLGRHARAEPALNGLYTPFWTFDAMADCDYVGQRGTTYMVPVRKSKGGTRMQQRIRWSPVQGHVRRRFDDLLVLASESLPRALTQRLEPWDLDGLVSYDERYLSGFRTERYRTTLDEGFSIAAGRMEQQLRADVTRDIGGDRQRIGRMSVRHSDVTYKHVLLPIWVAAYRYRDKAYRFVVNARTGEVHGERPYSWTKIMATVAITVAVAVAIYYAYVTFAAR